MDRNSRVTAGDVAAVAGVSRTTVGYVLNDTPHQKIPQATRDRVHDAARLLGYAPSVAARMLKGAPSKVIVILLPDWPLGHVVNTLVQRMTLKLSHCQYTLLSHTRGPDSPPISQMWETLTPAAVMVLQNVAPETETALRGSGAEVVMVMDFYAPALGRGGQSTEPGRVQAEHLIERGHRMLGYASTDDHRLTGLATDRIEGVRQACARHALPDPEVQVITTDIADAARAVRAWRSATPPVTAVCAYNDDVALAVLAGMRQEGLTAPTDIAVIGADDITAAQFADPPLTSLRFPIEHWSDHFVQQVLDAVGGSAPASPGTAADTAELTLVIRESS